VAFARPLVRTQHGHKIALVSHTTLHLLKISTVSKITALPFPPFLAATFAVPEREPTALLPSIPREAPGPARGTSVS
jgi:hypothetical protein